MLHVIACNVRKHAPFEYALNVKLKNKTEFKSRNGWAINKWLKKRMECEKIEKKYTPELSEKELEKLRNSQNGISEDNSWEHWAHEKNRP